MAVLNSWQRIDRVIPGRPFGNGSDGSYSSATAPTLTKDSCSGSASSSTLTTTSATFANGDLLLIHQTRGTGAGQWEINKVSSGGGSTTLTLQTTLYYTYTDSGASQAQAIKIPQYTDVTIQSGTWTPADWDGNVGGIFVMALNGTLTPTGSIELNGTDGTDINDGQSPSDGGGFRGGACHENGIGHEGEGTAGDRDSQSTSANGNGGGGAANSSPGKGSGGGHGAAGTNGTSSTGGSSVGSVDLTSLNLGGGGGGGGDASGGDQGSGANGGGAIMIFAKDIATMSGTFSVNGGQGGDGGGSNGGGGGGAGGSVLIVCQTATLGTNKLTATAGSAGVAGTAGAVGRIAVHHSATITGTSSPTFEDQSDPSMIESSGFFAFL